MVNVLFQFDWHFIEPNNSDTVLHRMTFPPSGLLFRIVEVPGIGLTSLSKSAGFGSADIKLFRLDPETEHFFLLSYPEVFSISYSPRINSLADISV